MTSSARSLAHIICGSLIIAIPSLLNGYPFIYWDTAEYFAAGDYIPHVILFLAGQADVAQSIGFSSKSAFYGLFLRGAVGAGGLWLLAFIQAMIGSWLIWLAFRILHMPRRPLSFHLFLLCVTLFTALPFFAAFAMPDVFAAYALIAAGLLLGARDMLSRAEAAGLCVLLCFAMLAHQTVLPLLLIMLWAVMAVSRFAPVEMRPAPGGYLRILGAATVAVLLLVGYGVALRGAVVAAPHSPPYLSARFLADGPARDYLREACRRGTDYALCRYRYQPFDTENHILWSGDPRIGVYQLAGRAGQQRLAAEDLRFAWESFRHDPAAHLRVMAANWIRQLGRFKVGHELDSTHRMWNEMVGAYLPGSRPAWSRSLAYRGLMPFRAIDLTHSLALAISVLFLAYRLSRRDFLAWRAPGGEGRTAGVLMLAAGILAVMILANAALCGMLAGMFARYEARLIWMLPGLALIVAMVAGVRQRAPAGEWSRIYAS